MLMHLASQLTVFLEVASFTLPLSFQRGCVSLRRLCVQLHLLIPRAKGFMDCRCAETTKKAWIYANPLKPSSSTLAFQA
jgi:hypothetical protein